jgi:hypothetical protein
MIWKIRDSRAQVSTESQIKDSPNNEKLGITRTAATDDPIKTQTRKTFQDFQEQGRETTSLSKT